MHTVEKLSRRLAMKQGAGLAAAVAGVAAIHRVSAARGGVAKVDVCHIDGDGTYRVITIGEPAVESHLANHDGDHLLVDTCTGECGGFCDEDAGETCVDGVCTVV